MSALPHLSPAQAVMAEAMSEADLQAAVVGLAQQLGYAVFHPRPIQGADARWVTAVAYDGVGYPDLTLVGRGQVLFRELKSTTGRTGNHQSAWIRVLTEAGADVAVWRPADWFSGLIHQQLENQCEDLSPSSPSSSPSVPAPPKRPSGGGSTT